MTQKHGRLEIVYEDDYLVVINKEAGMLTVADRFNHESVHLQSILRNKYGKIFTVHRLDRDTSGLIVFAKDAETHRMLSEDFLKRNVRKFYHALVQGKIDDEGLIDEPLAESPHKAGKIVVYKKGKPSQTKYKLLESFDICSSVEVELLTGRTHQIRVHMAHIGNALFVDHVYGKRDKFFLSELKGRKYKKVKGKEERPLVSRQTLHAQRLIFDHPQTHKKMELIADLPKDMRALLNQLRKIG